MTSTQPRCCNRVIYTPYQVKDILERSGIPREFTASCLEDHHSQNGTYGPQTLYAIESAYNARNQQSVDLGFFFARHADKYRAEDDWA